MAWSTPDLSDITHVLRGLIESAVNASALQHAQNIKVLCDSPDTARATDGHCHLNIYLLHVGRDPFWRNTPVQGPRPQLNSSQPLSLNLSYLLTAWCDKDFALEQRAMSIALQTIHANPIVNQTLIIAESLTQWLPKGEFVISIEADTIEEMSRLWQAFTVPMRLSALIRVGVVFIDPVDPPRSATGHARRHQPLD
jgi:Pvc16 N-terminal domain